MVGRWSSWAVPPRVLTLCGVATVVLVAPLVVGYLMGGVPGAVGLGLGYFACVRAGATLRRVHAAGIAVATALAAAVAVALRGQPLPAACFVALCCLLVAPANQLVGSLLAGIPGVVAVLLLAPGTYEVGRTPVWVLFGGLLVVALTGRLAPRAEAPEPLPAELVLRHAAVLAVVVGAAVYAVGVLAWPHGYWVALTLTVVLRAFPDQTMARASRRTLAAVAGVLLSLVLAALLPLPVVLAALAACFLLTLAYTVTGDQTRQMLFLTPTVVLLGSAGSTGGLAGEWGVATAGGAALAVLAALTLAWFDTRGAGRATG